MFFSKKKAEVLYHSHALVENFQTSVGEFYDAIERELHARQIPDLEIRRVDWNEGGLLSSKREYLRLSRERLVFDICAAPFGSAFFFSCRYAELPVVVHPAALLLVFILVNILFEGLLRVFGFMWGVFLLLTLLAGGVYVLRHAVSLGLANLDATLTKTPLLGPVYERWLRKETYYREDTRLMYLETVPAVVKKVVEEVTGGKGIRLSQTMLAKPVLPELAEPRAGALVAKT